MKLAMKAILLLPFAAGLAYAAEESTGIVHVPAFDLPQSPALSPEAQAYFANPRKPPDGGDRPEAAKSDAEYAAEQRKYLVGFDAAYGKPLADKAISLYPVKIADSAMGGVPVETFEPTDGIAPGNKNRVLISLRGGSVGALGSRYINQTASVPIANLGRIRVVSVLHKDTSLKFPSASEDVAAVYKALLKHYPAKNIGIYGCSAGGILTAQTVAWLISKKITLPGAAAVLGVGVQTAVEKPVGDSVYITALAEGRTPPAPGTVKPGKEAIFGPHGYYSAAGVDDPLVDPMADPTLLAKFPPTMLLTGTRAFDLSPVIAAQRAMEKAGVETTLQLYDGMPHCFYAIPSLPESRDANMAIYRFFDRRLGR